MIVLSLVIFSSLIGAGRYSFPQVDDPQGVVLFRVTSDTVELLAEAEAGGADFAQNQEGSCQEERVEVQAQELSVSAARDTEQASRGWCSRVWSGVKRLWKEVSWQEASWKKRIVWGTLGITVVVSVGSVWLNGGYYLVYKSIKDFYTHCGGNASKLVSGGSGMVLCPTSSEMATSVMASAAGATASSVLTPTERPPLNAGVCDLVETNLERYLVPGGADCWGTYDGLCVHTHGCAYNGDLLYHNGSGIVCRCKRACNAPPKDLPCYRHNPGGPESCDHTPLCDRCRAHWCKVCNGWIPEATNITDPVPSRADMNAWMRYHGLQLYWQLRYQCVPGSS